MLKLGSTSIGKAYLGDTEIKKAYLGNVLLLDTTAYTFTDADAEAYSDAIGTLTELQKEYVDDFVIIMKSSGIWAKTGFVAIKKYADASKNAVNIKNTATFGFTYVGGITHGATGATGNGSTGYAYNGYVPSAQQTLTGQHYGVVVASNNTPVALDSLDLGSANGTSQLTAFGTRGPGGTIARMNATVRTVASSDASGTWVVARTTANVRVYKNGTEIINATGGGSLPTFETYYWNINFGGSPYADGYSNQTYSAIFGGTGLNATEAANMTTYINTLLSVF